MRHQVDADQVEQAEQAGGGEAHHLAGDRVGLLDGEPVIQGGVDARLHPHHADAVGDKARRVVAANDAFAQLHVAEPGQRFGHLGRCVPAGDQLQQAHIARRVEEMGDGEIAPERLRPALDQVRERDRRGVGGDDRARLPHGFQLLRRGCA